MIQQIPPLLGFCAYSGTGKTTLLTKLIPVLGDKGLKIGLEAPNLQIQPFGHQGLCRSYEVVFYAMSLLFV